MGPSCFVREDFVATFSSLSVKNPKLKSISLQAIYFNVKKPQTQTTNKLNSRLSFLSKVINTWFELVFFCEIQQQFIHLWENTKLLFFTEKANQMFVLELQIFVFGTVSSKHCKALIHMPKQEKNTGLHTGWNSWWEVCKGLHRVYI